MKAETRRQSIILFEFSWELQVEWLKFPMALPVSMNDHENTFVTDNKLIKLNL